MLVKSQPKFPYPQHPFSIQRLCAISTVRTERRAGISSDIREDTNTMNCPTYFETLPVTCSRHAQKLSLSFTYIRTDPIHPHADTSQQIQKSRQIVSAKSFANCEQPVKNSEITALEPVSNHGRGFFIHRSSNLFTRLSHTVFSHPMPFLRVSNGTKETYSHT